ncbi:zinc/iron-chelating domain-containing protein [Pandoraea nosoerga]|uniref:Zinc/iron-chelating domain-containing protein n=2 Tax=Burkholderiaceae TaxID=119060 RepID=A0A5E4T5Q9_9BURK|nr:zinc/iron-chelating domain-containing protein [Pandoraea nosoerga]
MPNGKPANTRCVQLDDEDRCRLFGSALRPAVCGSLQPSAQMCGSDRAQAIAWLSALEAMTAPGHA